MIGLGFAVLYVATISIRYPVHEDDNNRVVLTLFYARCTQTLRHACELGRKGSNFMLKLP